jgi:uncharacterized membrane protein
MRFTRLAALTLALVRCGLLMLVGLSACLAGAGAVAPFARAAGWEAFANDLYGFLAHLCHQLPSRTLWMLGAPTGLCSRSLFLGGAFAIAGGYLLRQRRTLPWQRVILLVSPILVDTITQSAGWRTSTNLLRALTGTLAGIGLAGLASHVWCRSCGDASTPHPRASSSWSMSAVSGWAPMLAIVATALLVAAWPGAGVPAESEVAPSHASCEVYAQAVAELETPHAQSHVGGGPALCLFMPIILPVGLALDAAEESKRYRAKQRSAYQGCLTLADPADSSGERARELVGIAHHYGTLGEQYQSRAAEQYRLGAESGHPSDSDRSSMQGKALEAHALELWQNAAPLYKRALTLQETGADAADLPSTLDDYAWLLRKMHRNADADEMVARAKALRERHEPSSGVTP